MDKVWISLLHVSYFWELKGEGGNEKFNLFCVTVCYFFFLIFYNLQSSELDVILNS